MEKKFWAKLGKLCAAIIESRIETVIGKPATEMAKEQIKEYETREILGEALVKAEKRFRGEMEDKELSRALLDLPLSNLPSIQRAFQDFYLRPFSPDFANLLKKKLMADYPNFTAERIDNATHLFIEILTQELIPTSDEARRKLIATAILGVGKQLNTISEHLFEILQKPSPVISYIKNREFKTLISERTRNFIGREFIFKALNEDLSDPNFPSGYILISGEPGIGKTSIAAQLVKEKGYLHHFNIRSQSICSEWDFLSNICAQLITYFNLEYSSIPDHALHNSGFLSRLLSEAAERNKFAPLVIVVDALDEVDLSGASPTANVLLLPSTLPKNTYFILTSREQHEYRLLVDRRKDIHILDKDPSNLEDIRSYIEWDARKDTEFPSILTGWNTSLPAFTDLLTEKSDGNFMYIVHILKDIQNRKLTPQTLGKLENIPAGLKDYYHRHWAIMKELEGDKFKDLYQPVICILATSVKPVSVQLMSKWLQLTNGQVKEVFETWQQFLNADSVNGEYRYRIYHPSFQDFLKEEVGLKPYYAMIAKNLFEDQALWD